MNILNLQTSVYHFSLNLDKQAILHAIESSPQSSFKDKANSIYNTNAYTSLDNNWESLVLPAIQQSADVIAQDNFPEGGVKLTVSEPTLYQYQKGDFSYYHVHGNCNYNAVYYVELPPENSTVFINREGKEFRIDVKEGDLVVFPSILMHGSKVNHTEQTKTVIGASLNYG